MMIDLIERQAAIDLLLNMAHGAYIEAPVDEAVEAFRNLPSAEPEISRIEKELHGKTPEEQYEFIYWLLFKSFEATAYSNSRLAIIDWLKGDKGNG